jgi:pyruvate formate lyase activating enzyme
VRPPEEQARQSDLAAEASGMVFDVQRCSFHDGPGIRTTVFFKGCPLRCRWCHNPEGISSAPEIVADPARCLGCGACRAACPRPEGPLARGRRLGEDGCSACVRCGEACPTGARRIAGDRWTVSALMAEVRRDLGVFEESGGGVTFSGGEPMAQAAFLRACLEACRREGIGTAVETCGFAAREVALSIAERADLLLWDVKHLDPERHRELTGAPLEPILANLRAIAGVGTPVWLRVPVVPGLNDAEDDLRRVARLASEHPSVRRVSLLPYHRTGTRKLSRLGRDDVLAGLTSPTDERMQELAALFAGTGRETKIGG